MQKSDDRRLRSWADGPRTSLIRPCIDMALKAGSAAPTLINGLWKNNPGVVQLLGLCPLLAVSTSFMTSLTLGLATIFVLVASNTLIACVGRFVLPHLRMPIFVLIIAGFVTIVQLLLAAYRFDLYQSLGIFLALITTNCVIMGRAESFAYKNPAFDSAMDGLGQGMGFTLVLVILGTLREFIGQGFLLAILPAGAFILMGLLIAAKNWIQAR